MCYFQEQTEKNVMHGLDCEIAHTKFGPDEAYEVGVCSSSGKTELHVKVKTQQQARCSAVSIFIIAHVDLD